MAVEIYADTIGELYCFQEWINEGSIRCPSLPEIYPDLEINLEYDISTDRNHTMLKDNEKDHVAGILYEDGSYELAEPYKDYDIEIEGEKTNDTNNSK